MDGYESDTYISDELVDAGESLFCLDAGLQLKFISLLVPDLEAFVELAHEMRSNLVINHTHKSTSAVFRWISDIDARLARLRIVRHTSRRHLCLFELDGEELFEAQGFVVVAEGLDGLVTSDNVTLCLQVG